MPCPPWRKSSSWLRFRNLFNCMCFIPVLAVLSPAEIIRCEYSHLQRKTFLIFHIFMCFHEQMNLGGMIKCFQLLWFIFVFNRKRAKTVTSTETQEFGVGSPSMPELSLCIFRPHFCEGSYKKANKASSHTPTERTSSNSEEERIYYF